MNSLPSAAPPGLPFLPPPLPIPPFALTGGAGGSAGGAQSGGSPVFDFASNALGREAGILSSLFGGNSNPALQARVGGGTFSVSPIWVLGGLVGVWLLTRK